LIVLIGIIVKSESGTTLIIWFSKGKSYVRLACRLQQYYIDWILQMMAAQNVCDLYVVLDGRRWRWKKLVF